MTAVSISRDALEKAIEALEAAGATASAYGLNITANECYGAAANLRAALTAETKIPGREEIAEQMRSVMREKFVEVFKRAPSRMMTEHGGPVGFAFGIPRGDVLDACHEAVDAALPLLPAQAEEWRDIAIAPKEIVRSDGNQQYGAWIFAADRWGNMQEVQWWQYKNDTACNFLGRDGSAFSAKFWRPLPPPPDLKSKDTVTK